MFTILLSNFLILCLFTYLGYALIPLRNNHMNTNLLKFLCCYSFVCFTNFNGPSIIGLVCLIIIHFVYYFIMFKGKTLYSLLILIPFPLIIIASEFLIANFLNILLQVNLNTSINSGYYMLAIVLSDIVILLFLIPYIKLLKLFKGKKFPRYTWVVAILPFSTFLFLLTIFKTHFYLIEVNNLLFVSIVGIFISNFVFIYIFFMIIHSLEYKTKLIIAQNQEVFLNENIKLIETNYDSNFKLLHNLLHKCKLFKDNIEMKNYSTLEKEVSELYDITFKEFNLLYTNSPTIYSLMHDKLEEIIKENIDIKTNIEYNNLGFLNLREQKEVFSLILDKAISSNLKMPISKRYIILKVLKKEMQIILHMTYSSLSEEPFLENNLNTVLEQHNAILSERFDNTLNAMSILIMFPSLVYKD